MALSPGSANPLPVGRLVIPVTVFVTSVTGVKKVTLCVAPLKLPAPMWNEPGPLLGRHTPVSCSRLQTAPDRPGVQGRPPAQLTVPLICQPPITSSTARPTPPANDLPLPKGNSYTRFETH